MSAAELRKAAETLRKPPQFTVAEITNGVDSTTAYQFPDGFYLDRRGRWPQEPRPGVEVTRRFHETARPDLASVLADWLDQCADRLDKGHHTGSRHSHRIARLVNGGAS